MDATAIAEEVIKVVGALKRVGMVVTRADVFKSVHHPQPLVARVIEELARRGFLELGPDGRVALVR